MIHFFHLYMGHLRTIRQTSVGHKAIILPHSHFTRAKGNPPMRNGGAFGPHLDPKLCNEHWPQTAPHGPYFQDSRMVKIQFIDGLGFKKIVQRTILSFLNYSESFHRKSATARPISEGAWKRRQFRWSFPAALWIFATSCRPHKPRMRAWVMGKTTGLTSSEAAETVIFWFCWCLSVARMELFLFENWHAVEWNLVLIGATKGTYMIWV